MRVEKQQRFFVLGIQHRLSLNADHEPDVRPKGAFSMRGHSVGGYGSVTTNKVIATIVGDLFRLQVQAYPMYGSEKKGLADDLFSDGRRRADPRPRRSCDMSILCRSTTSMLLIWVIRSPGLVPGGTVFVQHQSRDPASGLEFDPGRAHANLFAKIDIRVVALDAVKVAQELSSHPQFAQRMQGIVLLGVFSCAWRRSFRTRA